MPMRMISKQGMAPTKDLGEGVSGAAFLTPPRGGRILAIYSRWYAMRVLLGVMVLWLCGCASEPKAFVVPAGTEGGWKLAGQEEFAAPDWMKTLGIKRAVRARYGGPIDTVVDFHEMGSETAAFECAQKYQIKKTEDRFYKANLFVVVRSEHPNREMLMDFSRALQKGL